MLQHTNNIVSIYRLTDTAGERSMVLLTTGLYVYLQSKQDAIETGFDGQNSYYPVLMLVNWKPNILVWDKVVDKDNVVYKVKASETFSDLTGTHSRFLLTLKYD